jgi:predicted PurR-regulated permease PerM
MSPPEPENETSESAPVAPAPPPRPTRGGGMPIDVRSVALTCIFLLALFHTLYVAKTLVFPMLLAVLAYFCLVPVVRTLRRFLIPAPLGAAVVVVGVVATLVSGIYFLATPASQWASRLPSSLTRIEHSLRHVREPIEQLVEASDKVEDMADVDEDKVQQVEVRRFSLAENILSQTRAVLTTGATVLVLLYFLLAAGDSFFLKIAQALPQIADKAAAKQLIYGTEAEISHYLFTITFINACLGGATALVLWALDMPNPILWGSAPESSISFHSSARRPCRSSSSASPCCTTALSPKRSFRRCCSPP